MSAPPPLDAALLRSHPLPAAGDGGKDDRGRVMIVGGDRSLPGAPLLAGTAAFRAGAGKLQLAVTAGAAVPLGLAVPEALVIGVPEAADGGMSRQGISEIAARLCHCDAVAVGPGMMGGETAAIVAALLEQPPGPAFLFDAGALDGLMAARAVLAPHAGRSVITPHAGEMAALMGISRSVVEDDPLGMAREAAGRLGVVVVMKGAASYVVTPGGEAWRYPGGGAGLGVSGSGDCLAGLITGLLARGARPADAALWGVYLHGEAGRRLAGRIGPLGFLAREIAGEVPAILAGLEQSPPG